jgi:hypothetical protein
MTNVTATATGGTNNYGVANNSSSPTIRNSSITGTTYSRHCCVGRSEARRADDMSLVRSDRYGQFVEGRGKS